MRRWNLHWWRSYVAFAINISLMYYWTWYWSYWLDILHEKRYCASTGPNIHIHVPTYIHVLYHTQVGSTCHLHPKTSHCQCTSSLFSPCTIETGRGTTGHQLRHLQQSIMALIYTYTWMSSILVTSLQLQNSSIDGLLEWPEYTLKLLVLEAALSSKWLMMIVLGILRHKVSIYGGNMLYDLIQSLNRYAVTLCLSS